MDTSHEKWSGSDEWWTPRSIFQAMPEGTRFTMDPCPARFSPATEYCDDHEPCDGLQKEWRGLIWCNPPYSAIRPFMARFAEHRNGVALVFARVGTDWWQQHVVARGAAVLYMRRRVSFQKPDGSKTGSAGADSALVGLGSGRMVVSMTDLDGVLVNYDAGHCPRPWRNG